MEARKMSVTLWRLLSKSSLGECFATRTYTNYSKSDDQSPTEKLKQVQVVFSKSQNPDPDNMHLLCGTYRKWWDIGSGLKHDSLTTRTQQKTPSNVDCSHWANILSTQEVSVSISASDPPIGQISAYLRISRSFRPQFIIISFIWEQIRRVVLTFHAKGLPLTTPKNTSSSYS